MTDHDTTPIIVVDAPPTRTAERRYVLDQVLGDWLGTAYELRSWDRPLMSLARHGQPEAGRILMPDILFSTSESDWLTERALPTRPLRRATIPGGPSTEPETVRSTATLPILFGRDDRPSAWVRTETGLEIGIDIFGGIFAMLTRMEELVPVQRDAHDRFPLAASLAEAEGFVERPLVDEYVDLLAQAMATLWSDAPVPRSELRLRLTHDIDTPWSALGRPASAVPRSVLGDLLKRRDPRLAARRVRALADARRGAINRDPLYTFDFLMDTSERHGLRSTFYFQAGTTPTDEDHRYRLTDAPFGSVLQRIHRRGHEIGLHGSYGSYASADRLAREAEALRSTCGRAGVEQAEWGGRQHYLRFANPLTWRYLEAAGLAHDSTIGFAERPGFRSGTCREHSLFDLVDRRPLTLRERPLIVMDATLFGYLDLDFEEAASRAVSLVDLCRPLGGDPVILYHNDTVAGDRAKSHYRDLVAALSAGG